jgi:hypothetical protein
VSVSPASRGLQPWLGLAGVMLVVPVAVALGVGLGTPERSLLVLGPISTFALPVIAMIAFWWEDWPGTMLGAPLPGFADTLLAAAGGVVLTVAGQALVGHVDARGLFDASAPPAHVPTFPATLAPAGAIFVVMLQLTLVSERGPLRNVDRVPAGVVAFAVSCVAGTALYVALVDFHPPPGAGVFHARSGPVSTRAFASVLTCIAALQVLFYVVLRAWPFREIVSRPVRLAVANACVIAGGCLSYVALADVAHVEALTITALAGSAVAGGLVVGMLFEGWLDGLWAPARARVAQVAAVALLSALLYVGLRALAQAASWSRAEPQDWTAYAGLNAIGLGVLLHVGIGRRWPFVASIQKPAVTRPQVREEAQHAA